MSLTVAAFLPAGPDQPWRWLELRDGAVARRGDGAAELAAFADTEVIAIPPADAVALHWAELPDRSLAQATAAARLLIAEASVTPAADLHVAVGAEPDRIERPIGVVAAERMRDWLSMLAALGIDPAAVIPAPMLLPRPQDGYVLADFGDGGRVLRGVASGFADEPGLTGLITEGVAPAVLDRDALEQSIAAALVNPPLDLRQGPFAVRRRTAIDWETLRRVAWLAVAVLTVTLAISLVRIARYGVAADALEARVDTIARAGLPSGTTINDADRQVDERLTKLRGGGLGFSRTAATVFAVIRSVPGAQVTSVDFAADGTMKLGVATTGEGEAVDVLNRLRATGLGVAAPSQFVSSGGKVTGQFVVTPS